MSGGEQQKVVHFRQSSRERDGVGRARRTRPRAALTANIRMAPELAKNWRFFMAKPAWKMMGGSSA